MADSAVKTAPFHKVAIRGIPPMLKPHEIERKVFETTRRLVGVAPVYIFTPNQMPTIIKHGRSCYVGFETREHATKLFEMIEAQPESFQNAAELYVETEPLRIITMARASYQKTISNMSSRLFNNDVQMLMENGSTVADTMGIFTSIFRNVNGFADRKPGRDSGKTVTSGVSNEKDAESLASSAPSKVDSKSTKKPVDSEDGLTVLERLQLAAMEDDTPIERVEQPMVSSPAPINERMKASSSQTSLDDTPVTLTFAQTILKNSSSKNKSKDKTKKNVVVLGKKTLKKSTSKTSSPKASEHSDKSNQKTESNSSPVAISPSTGGNGGSEIKKDAKPSDASKSKLAKKDKKSKDKKDKREKKDKKVKKDKKEKKLNKTVDGSAQPQDETKKTEKVKKSKSTSDQKEKIPKTDKKVGKKPKKPSSSDIPDKKPDTQTLESKSKDEKSKKPRVPKEKLSKPKKDSRPASAGGNEKSDKKPSHTKTTRVKSDSKKSKDDKDVKKPKSTKKPKDSNKSSDTKKSRESKEKRTDSGRSSPSGKPSTEVKSEKPKKKIMIKKKDTAA